MNVSWVRLSDKANQFFLSPLLRSCASYGFLALHIEASACYVWCSRQRMCRNGVSDSHKLQTWLYELADPQFTAVYAESQNERRECHDSAETLTHWETLQSNVTSWYGALTGCQYCHLRLAPLSVVSANCASTLESMCEKYGSFNTSDCQSCFSSMTLRAPGLAVLTEPQIGETIFMLAGSTECPVWLKKFSVQTVSYPEKWFGLLRRLL